MKTLTICSKCAATGADTTGYLARVMRTEKKCCDLCGRKGSCTLPRKNWMPGETKSDKNRRKNGASGGAQTP